MNPYLKIPLSLPGDPEKGNEDTVVEGEILPAHVIAFHPGYSWGTFLYLTTGQAFLTPWTRDEYVKAVQDYWLQVGKNMAKNKLKLMQ
jgi:hypothetical protein